MPSIKSLFIQSIPCIKFCRCEFYKNQKGIRAPIVYILHLAGGLRAAGDRAVVTRLVPSFCRATPSVVLLALADTALLLTRGCGLAFLVMPLLLSFDWIPNSCIGELLWATRSAASLGITSKVVFRDLGTLVGLAAALFWVFATSGTK